MARRLEIELTSLRPDGSFTWRAAGAREPKGVVESTLLYPAAKVGDVVRAEADFDLEGVVITQVTAPTGAREDATKRIVIVGSGKEEPLVNVSLAKKSGGPRGDRDKRRDGGDSREPRGGRDAKPRDNNRGGPRGERTDRPGASSARGRDGAPRSNDREPRTPRPPREASASRTPRFVPKAPPKKIVAGDTHRAAALLALSEEQRPIAEQLLRGGIAAVRSALISFNKSAKEEGRAEQPEVAVMQTAEEIWPQLKTASWRDRAEACLAIIDDVGLRDLRQLVSEADQVARDDDTRVLATSLKSALETRAAKAKQDWQTEFDDALNNGRLVRALRMSARLPDPTMRLDAEVSQKLADLTSAALNADTANERWAMLIEAAGESAVRRLIKPVALPATPNDALKAAATAQASNIPALVALLGLTVPPPPRPSNKHSKNKSFSSSLKVSKPRNVGTTGTPAIGASKPAPVAVPVRSSTVAPVTPVEVAAAIAATPTTTGEAVTSPMATETSNQDVPELAVVATQVDDALVVPTTTDDKVVTDATDNELIVAEVVEQPVSVQELDKSIDEAKIVELSNVDPTDLGSVASGDSNLVVVENSDSEVKDN
jgi:hypothetical protein